ncbi:bst1 [Symbiodinium pilosum]|uniref:Bst1 protein n=1 Tax=Symbiodinium pilosum TaxID=2952 RepID=A0A812Y0M5_SYMPI|nr:bst1 [Symbiodinium pilosum]
MAVGHLTLLSTSAPVSLEGRKDSAREHYMDLDAIRAVRPIPPIPEELPWPRFLRAPRRFRSSRGSFCSDSSDGLSDDFQIRLGPCTIPGKLEKLRLSRSAISSAASCESYRSCIRLSDYIRIKSVAPDGPELSFGSALHVGDGTNALCLVCSYHKPPARSCKNGAFCDFCHLHDGRRNSRRRRREAAGLAAGRMSWADTEIQVLQAIQL